MSWFNLNLSIVLGPQINSKELSEPTRYEQLGGQFELAPQAPEPEDEYYEEEYKRGGFGFGVKD